MQTVTSYGPIQGETQVINLLQQSGYTEVINDSNSLLIIQTNNGSCWQIPGEVQIYPTPLGGGTFAIQAQVFYLALDVGVSDTVTVNQYLEDELVGTNYPYFITRSVASGINKFAQVVQSTTVTNLTAGMSVSAGAVPVNDPSNLSFYLTGVDMSIDQEGTAHGWTLTITGLTNIITYVGHTKTAEDTQLILRWNEPLVSINSGAAINVVAAVAPVSGGTARAALQLFGFYQ
jgi:hypothetical protein